MASDVISSLTHSKHFSSKNHQTTLLRGLNDLRSCDELLDITLLAEGQKFKAHRAVLAACSDYFRAMFTDGMKEAHQSEIYLKGLTANGLELILHYAYTSELELNLSNIGDILSAATHVQMDALVEACSMHLETYINFGTCVDIAALADLYSLEDLKRKTYRFICCQIKEFSQTSLIQHLSWEQFEYLLSCDFPVDCTEEELLEITLRWCSEKRMGADLARKLFSRIRFREIDPDRLEIISRAFGKYTTAIETAVAEQNIELELRLGNLGLTNSRGLELALLQIGGFVLDSESGITNNITCYFPSNREWFNLTSIPHVLQANYGSTVLRNELYVVGGCYNAGLKEFIHPFGFRYCPTRNEWKTIAEMQNDRCRFSLNAMGDYLYAVGGVSDNADFDDMPESNCERYNTLTDRWEYIQRLPENRTQHAGVVHGQCLYISGGFSFLQGLSSMWEFSASSQQWRELTPMPTARIDHVMLVIGDKIYVCGGWCEDAATGSRHLFDTIIVYDIQANTWSEETKVPVAKYHTGVAAVGGKIYIVGGLRHEQETKRKTADFHCYDLETKEWVQLDRYPQNIWESTCLALYVPSRGHNMKPVANSLSVEFLDFE